MAKFEQDISEFDDFLQKRRRNSTLIEQDNVSKPKFELEEKTEKAQKCNSRRKYNNAKNKAFLEHLTKGTTVLTNNLGGNSNSAID